MNNQGNNYEKLDLAFHTRVRDGFLEIAKIAKNRCIVINADASVASIHKLIIDNINSIAGLNIKAIS